MPSSQITYIDALFSVGITFHMNRAVGGLVSQPPLDGRTDQSCSSLSVAHTVYAVAGVFGDEYLDFENFTVVNIIRDQRRVEKPRASI